VDKLLDSAATLLNALVHYPRAEIFVVLAFSLLVPLVALTCIYVRDHRRTGGGRLD
jgi:hypothetical protein